MLTVFSVPKGYDVIIFVGFSDVPTQANRPNIDQYCRYTFLDDILILC